MGSPTRQLFLLLEDLDPLSPQGSHLLGAAGEAGPSLSRLAARGRSWSWGLLWSPHRDPFDHLQHWISPPSLPNS